MTGESAYIAKDSVNHCPLLNLHLGLRDGAVALDLDGAAAEQMQNVVAALHAGVAGGDEFFKRSLLP